MSITLDGMARRILWNHSEDNQYHASMEDCPYCRIAELEQQLAALKDALGWLVREIDWIDDGENDYYRRRAFIDKDVYDRAWGALTQAGGDG